MHHYFIINPAAGQGQASSYIPQIEQYFTVCSKPEPYTIYTTRGASDVTPYVSRICAETAEPIRFYACGGDGTLNEVVTGVIGHPHASVGVIPAGTGNDFVRSFQGSSLFQQIAAQIEGTDIAIDLIQINDRYAINMVNIGFDCNVAFAAGQLKQKPLLKGPLAYLAGVVQQLCHHMGSLLQFHIAKGQPGAESISGEFLLCTIANGSFCGGGFQSSPKAELTDGQLDLAIIKTVPRLKFLALLPSYRTGRYLERLIHTGLVTYRQCESLEIIAATPLSVCIDGEISSFTSLQIRVLPQAIRFAIPRGAFMRSR